MEFDEYDEKVLRAIQPGYDYLILVIPGQAGINDFAAAASLASLKKAKLVAFEGRGRFKTVYLTDEGAAARAQVMAKKAAA